LTKEKLVSEKTSTHWGQTTLGVLVIQGLIGPVISAIVGVILTLVVTRPSEVDWLAVVAVGVGVALIVFVAISLIARRLRQVVWGSVGKFFKWLFGARLTTNTGRDALDKQGYQRRSDEVANERKRSPRPTWRISHRDGDDFIYVHNSGYWVEDVAVRADPELFVFAGGAGEGFIKGRLGDNVPGGSTGKQVPGELTREGARRGVAFDLSWIDQNGDRQPETSGSNLPSTASLPAKPLQKVVRPTWQIGRPKQSPGPDILVLANGAEDRSGARCNIAGRRG
jgi:hypothetical protein